MFWALFLVPRLIFPAYSRAQQPATQVPSPRKLDIFVLEGQNGANDIRAPRPATIVVEVRDENQLPVEGAEVTFELPASGPGGVFEGQQHTFMARSSLQGQAAATYTPNTETGRFSVKVTATQDGRTGMAAILQINGRKPMEAQKTGGVLQFRWWKLAVVAGAGAAVGAILATRGSTTITLTPGKPTFGTP